VKRDVPSRETLLRAVRWAHIPGNRHTVADVCARFKISKSAYQKAAREMKSEAAFRGIDELVLCGLHPGGPTPIEGLIQYIEWIDRSTTTVDEVGEVLERLIAKGLVRRVGELFELTGEWP
jgi:hypothetical protein